PNYVAEFRVRESVEWVCLVTALVSLDDEVEIFSRGAGLVESEIVGTDEHDRMAGVGCEAPEPGDSIPEHGLRDRHVLQNDPKFAGLSSGHDATSSPSSRMPATRAAIYRGSTTRAVPKNWVSSATFSSTQADASGVFR